MNSCVTLPRKNSGMLLGGFFFPLAYAHMSCTAPQIYFTKHWLVMLPGKDKTKQKTHTHGFSNPEVDERRLQ